jgi:hypothetical protein
MNCNNGCWIHDGAQFKSIKPWYFVSRYPSTTNGCKIVWSFFGSGHGKDPHDRASVVVKRFIWCEQLNPHGHKLTNVEEVDFLREHLSYPLESTYVGKRKPLHQIFWHIKFGDVDRNSTNYAYEAIEGTMKIRSICALNKNTKTQLLVKSLVCLCVGCLDGKWDQCLNLPWTRNWIPKHLQHFDSRFVRDTILDNWDVGKLCFWTKGDDLV